MTLNVHFEIILHNIARRAVDAPRWLNFLLVADYLGLTASSHTILYNTEIALKN